MPLMQDLTTGMWHVLYPVFQRWTALSSSLILCTLLWFDNDSITHAGTFSVQSIVYRAEYRVQSRVQDNEIETSCMRVLHGRWISQRPSHHCIYPRATTDESNGRKPHTPCMEKGLDEHDPWFINGVMIRLYLVNWLGMQVKVILLLGR